MKHYPSIYLIPSRLIPAARSYPLHVHLIKSLVHLMNHTRTYIPLAPHILQIINTGLSPPYRSKSSTLKPLDLDTVIRAPQQYLKTRVYGETLIEEACFLLADYLATQPVQGSIAFPELAVPILVALRKALKSARNTPKARSGKEIAMTRALVERIEESVRWVEKQRARVKFGPCHLDQVKSWEAELRVDQSPLAKHVKLARKMREKRKALVEKGRKGEDELLED
jgi:nucleolar complex protein 2